jgi:Cd2+/Zn2+-exporting ATPase/Cu+-exporting ATPase
MWWHVVVEVYMHSKLEWLRIAVAGAAIALVWLGVLSPAITLTISIAAVIVSGYPVLREAAKAVLKRRMTMELSMAIAVIAALLAQEPFTAQVIVFFVLIAEELEHATIHRGRNSIGALLDLLPRTAVVKRGNELVEVPATEVKSGDTVVIRPGSRIVVDGTVTAGSTFVDEATITGESLPVEKLPGMLVFAGTVNQAGAIEVRAERVGADTAFGKIVHSARLCMLSRSPSTRVQRCRGLPTSSLAFWCCSRLLPRRSRCWSPAV